MAEAPPESKTRRRSPGSRSATRASDSRPASRLPSSGSGWEATTVRTRSGGSIEGWLVTRIPDSIGTSRKAALAIASAAFPTASIRTRDGREPPVFANPAAAPPPVRASSTAAPGSTAARARSNIARASCRRACSSPGPSRAPGLVRPCRDPAGASVGIVGPSGLCRAPKLLGDLWTSAHTSRDRDNHKNGECGEQGQHNRLSKDSRVPEITGRLEAWVGQHKVDEEVSKEDHVRDQHDVRPPLETCGLRQLPVEIDYRERYDERGKVREVRRHLDESIRREQEEGRHDDQREYEYERIVETPRVPAGEFPEPRADRMGAIDELPGEELEHDRLRRKQDEKADDQGPWSQERQVRELDSELVGGIRRDVVRVGRHGSVLRELVDDHRWKHHAEDCTNEEHAPLVDEQVPEPAAPPRRVFRSFAEGNPRGQDSFLLSTHEASDVPHPASHSVPFVAVIVDDHEIQAGGEGRESCERAEVRRGGARRRRRGGHEGCEGTAPDGGRDHDERDDQDGDEDEHDHHPVYDFEGSRDLATEEGDAEYEEEKPRAKRLDRRNVRRVWTRDPGVAIDEGEEALARRLRPAAPDERQVEQEYGQRRHEPESGGDATERCHGGLACRKSESTDLDIVEHLQDRGNQDDPPDPDEAGSGSTDRPRSNEPFSASDRDPKRDHARTHDVQDELFRPDASLDLESLLRDRKVGERQGRTAHADLQGFRARHF